MSFGSWVHVLRVILGRHSSIDTSSGVSTIIRLIYGCIQEGRLLKSLTLAAAVLLLLLNEPMQQWSVQLKCCVMMFSFTDIVGQKYV